MAPFHPVRYEARAFAARALAAVAVFCAIAIVLLAGSATGAAEAKQDKAEETVQVEPQAVGPAPQAHGNANSLGGAGKSDPADPVGPSALPHTTAPTPATDPAPAPSDDAGSGKGNSGEGAAPTTLFPYTTLFRSDRKSVV